MLILIIRNVQYHVYISWILKYSLCGDRAMLHKPERVNMNEGERERGWLWDWMSHDDVIKWKHFPRNCPFVWKIQWSPVNSPYKGRWCGTLMFSLIFAWTNSWINNRDAGDLRRRCAHYDVTAMAICIKTYEVPQDCTHSKCQPLLLLTELHDFHYNDVIISAMASQITSLTTVYSTIYSRTDKQKSKPRVTGLLEVNSPVTGELPTQRVSNDVILTQETTQVARLRSRQFRTSCTEQAEGISLWF